MAEKHRQERLVPEDLQSLVDPETTAPDRCRRGDDIFIVTIPEVDGNRLHHSSTGSLDIILKHHLHCASFRRGIRCRGEYDRPGVLGLGLP